MKKEREILINPKVVLLNHTKNPEIVVAQAGSLCYSSEGLRKNWTLEKAREFIKRVPKKHKSVFEHAVFSFYIEGISRACSHELVRHRIASYSQRSQRYINEKDFSAHFPERFIEIMGESWLRDKLEYLKRAYQEVLEKYERKRITREEANQDARYILPNATETKIYMTMNAGSLFNFFNLRMCNRAQYEIRNVAKQMYSLVYDIAPSIFENVGPDCTTKIGCQEGAKGCNLAKKVVEELNNLRRLNK